MGCGRPVGCDADYVRLKSRFKEDWREDSEEEKDRREIRGGEKTKGWVYGDSTNEDGSEVKVQGDSDTAGYIQIKKKRQKAGGTY